MLIPLSASLLPREALHALPPILHACLRLFIASCLLMHTSSNTEKNTVNLGKSVVTVRA